MKKLKPIRIRKIWQPMLTYLYANIHKDSKPTMLTPNYCKAEFKLFPVIPTMYVCMYYFNLFIEDIYLMDLSHVFTWSYSLSMQKGTTTPCTCIFEYIKNWLGCSWNENNPNMGPPKYFQPSSLPKFFGDSYEDKQGSNCKIDFAVICSSYVQTETSLVVTVDRLTYPTILHQICAYFLNEDMKRWLITSMGIRDCVVITWADIVADD